jgi:oxygen-dependent protoporphyrinogen oxidase
MRIVIAGGGIAGLSLAWALRARAPEVDVVVLERTSRPGGNIRTEHVEGYTCEWGPDGFLDNAPDTLRLIRSIGLEERLLPSSDAARRRFIISNGRLCEVPTSPLALLTSPLLSAAGKARIAWELFAEPRHEEDESIHAFAARRIGSEAADVLVDSMVSGVFAGDARQLSLRACFPKMRELEDVHGGLLRALWATRGHRSGIGGPSGRLTSFVGGMTELVDALAHALDRTVSTSSQVLQLDKTGGRTPGSDPEGYAVRTPNGTLQADAVVLAGPASEAAGLVGGFDSELSGLLNGIPTAPLAVVCLGYDLARLAACCPLEGFGFLVPRREPIRILGGLWETSIYPNRAPSGRALIRVMIGGALDPDAITLDDDQLLAIVRRDLASTMAITFAPEFVRVIRHTRGIPQYVRGHLARVERIAARLERHSGLYLAGNSYRGVSINACIADAGRLADTVLRQTGVHTRELAGA